MTETLDKQAAEAIEKLVEINQQPMLSRQQNECNKATLHAFQVLSKRIDIATKAVNMAHCATSHHGRRLDVLEDDEAALQARAKETTVQIRELFSVYALLDKRVSDNTITLRAMRCEKAPCEAAIRATRRRLLAVENDLFEFQGDDREPVEDRFDCASDCANETCGMAKATKAIPPAIPLLLTSTIAYLVEFRNALSKTETMPVYYLNEVLSLLYQRAGLHVTDVAKKEE